MCPTPAPKRRRKCPTCNQDLPESAFYLHWKPAPKKCRKCYRAGVNAQKLSKAREENPKLARRILDHRTKLQARGPCPKHHQWCFKCERHLHKKNFSKSALRTSNWCRGCNATYSVRRAMLLKQKAILHLGGKCIRCGWAGHWAGYDFHHHNPNGKEMGWGGNGMRKKSWERLLPELKKCKLLCRNCHSIIHASLDDEGLPNPEYVPAHRQKTTR